MDWYIKVLRNYVGFGGRARRKEFWMFVLVNIIFAFVLGVLDKMLGWQRAGGEGVLTTIYAILVFFTQLGRSVPAPARHRSNGLVAVSVSYSRNRLAGDPHL